MLRFSLLLVATIFGIACGQPQVGTPPVPIMPSPPSTVQATPADLTFCLTETNRYRAMRGKAALVRTSDLEAFTAAAAQNDGTKHVAHDYVQIHATGPGGENEVPWWPFSQFGSVQATIASGIALFWSEGPGGGHYENLIGNWTRVGCGVYIAQGEITVVQDFR